MESRYHVRSISLPSRLHSCTVGIDEELNKLKISEALSTSSYKADTIRSGLFGLGELYHYVDDLLRLPLTQRALVQHQQEKWVGEVLDGSVRLLDICGTTRDLLSQMKERVRDLQSDLRRRGGKEISIGAYFSARKKVKKEILKGLEALKRMESKLGFSSILGLDQNQAVLARLVREICSVTISILKLLLSFLSAPASKPKSGGWSVVSKLMMQKVKVRCEEDEEKANEVESVDAALRNLWKQTSSKDVDVERVHIQMAQTRLEALEVGIECLEGGLECMFRHLIQTRVSLLNILTP
ncbi:uncharacterized protein LOC122074207 [Macadamia integrifolia]|uniref:uncharacterized protein LOC122074207 n=1 Tax=Macadamia integrifolia TaxID=60698 RepID=UPI001C4FE1A6|nr:uncharacterized protein LOC122074207 [Macadamia integrifolia]